MSSVRVLVGTRRARSSSPPTASGRSGTSAARTSPAGRSITSRARPSIRIASTPRKPAAGSGRSFSAPTTAAKRGTSRARRRASRPRRPTACPRARATSSSTTRRRETGKPLTTHQWYDGTQHPWEFKRVWHLEPSLTDPDTVYAGVEDAAIFRSTDGGKAGTSWPACAATARAAMVARRRRHGPAHDPARSEQSRAHLHRHLGGRRLPHRRRRQDLEADQPRPASRSTSPIRTPRSATACTASRCTPRGRTCCSCRSTGT